MTIDLGFCWRFPNDSPENALPRLRDYGFDGVELWPDALKQHGTARWQQSLAAKPRRRSRSVRKELQQ